MLPQVVVTCFVTGKRVSNLMQDCVTNLVVIRPEKVSAVLDPARRALLLVGMMTRTHTICRVGQPELPTIRE